MSAKVAIIIPAFNQLAYCQECIASVLADNGQTGYRLILVDNGSTDGVGPYFDSVPGAEVIHSPENLGFAAGVNLGLRIVNAQEHVLLLNSDTVAPRGWLDRLTAALERMPETGMVGPYSNNVSGAQHIPGLELDSFDAINAYADGLAERNKGSLRFVARLVGFCMLIRNEAFQRVGMLDEAYGIGNFEDDDYCVRTLRAGYKLAIAEDAFVFHYGGRTFSAMGIQNGAYAALLERNQEIFNAKIQPRVEERADAAQAARHACDMGKRCLEAGKYKDALQYFIEGAKIYPQYAPCHLALAETLMHLGEYGRAYDRYSFAVKLAGLPPEMERGFWDCAARAGKTAEAQQLVSAGNAGNAS